MKDYIKTLEENMIKNNLLKIIDDYLLLFSEEKESQSMLLVYLEKSNDKDIIDWNNFNGHIVAGGFIYAKEEHKFLNIPAHYHFDFKYLFIVDKISKIKIERNELFNYKWKSI